MRQAFCSCCFRVFGPQDAVGREHLLRHYSPSLPPFSLFEAEWRSLHSRLSGDLLPAAYLTKVMVSGEVGAGKECTLSKWPIYFYYLVSSRLRWESGNSPRWTVTYLMGKKPGSKTGSNSLKVPRIATYEAGLWSCAINKCDIVMLPMIPLILLSLYINPVTLEFGHCNCFPDGFILLWT